MAVNCWLVWTGTEAASGDRVSDTRLAAAAVILSVALDCCVPDVAVRVTVPAFEPTAMPAELMLATVESEEIHCTELVTSFEVESE